MRTSHKATTLLLFAILIPGAEGCQEQAGEPPPAIAVTNSYLEAAVKDMLGRDVSVLRLAEPDMCPGHFDVRPSHLSKLRGCRVLLRFDIQESLDAKLAAAASDGLSIREVRVPGGLCEPDSYLGACRGTAEALVGVGLLEESQAERRLAEIETRVEASKVQCLREIEQAGLHGRAVIASVHQEGFCRWLGLNVVATFSGADTASIGEIDRAVQAGKQAGSGIVVANLPEGRKLADALAERLGAEVVVFANFPSVTNGCPSFDDLLTSNVRALVETAGP